MVEKILKDTQSTTVWVYEIIKQICKGDSHEYRSEIIKRAKKRAI